MGKNEQSNAMATSTQEKMASTTRNLSVDLRPATFDQFIGSNKIVQQIRSQLDSGRIPTAILLSGLSGTGKTTLSRCINNRLSGELVEINAADDTGVDAARLLGESSSFLPLLGAYKVIVLDEAHQLTKQAQNALLKHVEDAPASTIWILCTTEPSKIIPTLRGRCISYALQGLTTDQVALLVYRGLSHLNKKGMDGVEDFIKTLVEEGVTAPRSILMATERFVGGMDPLGAVFGSENTPAAFEIAKAVALQNWETVRAALSKVTNEEAMAIRAVTANYLKSMLLKDFGRGFSISSAIMELTKEIPFEGPLALADLSARLYRICEHTDPFK